MKNLPATVKTAFLAFLAVGLIFYLSGSLLAQDTLVKKPQKMMKIKVDVDEDGESVIIDTTFYLDEDFNMEEFEEAMKQYEGQMKNIEKYLKQMHVELEGEELEKALQEAHESLEDVYFDMPSGRNLQWKIRAPRHAEHYCTPGNMFFYGKPEGCCEPFRLKPQNRGESLNDVLGDIPMRAVKSYKIKETKDGKRITIDVSDDAMFDRDENILIWHGDAPPPPPPPPKINKEIIIEQNVDREEKPE